MHPTVFSLLAELMPQYGITSFRITRERLWQNLRLDRSRMLGKSIERIIFGALSVHAAPMLTRLGITTAREVKGVLNSGQMNEQYLLPTLSNLQDGLNEIYFHPGCLPDAEITARMPGYRHEEELSALLSSAVMQRIHDLGITLCNYQGDTKPYA